MGCKNSTPAQNPGQNKPESRPAGSDSQAQDAPGSPKATPRTKDNFSDIEKPIH
jgi:hypothetical protein